MKLEEALEINTHHASALTLGHTDKQREALKLGSEALKWYQEHRKAKGATKTMWLPGETEE